jgi:hypothetical protein
MSLPDSVPVLVIFSGLSLYHSRHRTVVAFEWHLRPTCESWSVAFCARRWQGPMQHRAGTLGPRADLASASASGSDWHFTSDLPVPENRLRCQCQCMPAGQIQALAQFNFTQLQPQVQAEAGTCSASAVREFD